MEGSMQRIRLAIFSYCIVWVNNVYVPNNVENTLISVLAENGITASKDMPRLINSLSQLAYAVKSYDLIIYDKNFNKPWCVEVWSNC